MVIYKYLLRPSTYQYIDMPMGARILSVHAQVDEIALWALVDEEFVITDKRRIAVFPTGKQLPTDFENYDKFIGTVLLAGGRVVFHVFDATMTP